MSLYAPKAGCPMCGIVATASHTTPNSPRSPSFPPGSTQPEVLWRDDNFTAYREKANPVSSKGHIIIAFKSVSPNKCFIRVFYLFASCAVCTYLPFIQWYVLSTMLQNALLMLLWQSSTDVPLLTSMRNLAIRLLGSLLPATTPITPSIAAPPVPLQNPEHQFKIGFITPPFKDNKIPVTDHLHLHAYIGPPDLMGWWRQVAYSPLAWYPIEDLIAEIRCVPSFVPTLHLADYLQK